MRNGSPTSISIKNCPKKKDPGSGSYPDHHPVPNLPQSWHSWHLTGSLRMVYMNTGLNQATNASLY